MKFRVRLLAFCMMIVVFLAGCASKPSDSDSSSQTGNNSSGVSSSDPAGSEEQQPDESESVNYYKYNTYLDLLEYLYETSNALDSYFAVVEYQDEFLLLTEEGFGDWRLSTDLSFIHSTLLMGLDEVMELTEEEPYYEELDTIVKGVVPAVEKVDGILKEIRDYISDDVWETDDYAGAAELHTRLMAAVDPFFNYYMLMDDCVDRMEEELNAETMEQLLQDGEMIAYHTMMSIQRTEALMGLVYAEENYEGEGVYLQNLEEVTPACEEMKESLNQLLEALNTKEERSKVTRINFITESEDSPDYQRFKNFVGVVERTLLRADEMMETANQNGDVEDTADYILDYYSDLIDCYNNYIVG